MLICEPHRVWAEIDLDAIRNNLINIKKFISPYTKICAVIKADGYGHGAVPIAENITDLVDFYAVATIEEALALREAGLKSDILVLGFVHPDYVKDAVLQDIRLTVFDYEEAKALSDGALAIGKRLNVHIKIDTGMNRIGLKPCSKSIDIIKQISMLDGLNIEGTFTHFHSADSNDLSSAYAQLKLFNNFCAELQNNGIAIPIKHCSNSAASILMPEANLDMVRLGIAIYGLYPSEYVMRIKLKPALSLKSRVVMVKEISAGETVGYGATFTAERNMIIATIPVGYADGYMRSLSNCGCVLIRGQRAEIIGRICMDQFMVDVTGINNVSREDLVTLIGRDGDKVLSMEEVAFMADSFNYEFACNINKRVPRIYYRNGKKIEFN